MITTSEQTLTALRLGAIETITLPDGYDRRKKPAILRFRRLTIEDIPQLRYGLEIWFASHAQPVARRCRVASQLKTWKRDPTRFECSFKYGMYESARMDAGEMMAKLLVPID